MVTADYMEGQMARAVAGKDPEPVDGTTLGTAFPSLDSVSLSQVGRLAWGISKASPARSRRLLRVSASLSLSGAVCTG